MKSVLKHPVYLLLIFGVSFLMFDLSYWILKNLPGTRNLQCIMGGYLTPFNLVYAAVFSILIGMFVGGFIRLFALKAENGKAKLASLSGLGFILATLTTFCTICTIPVISVFGFSIGLGFFTTYNAVLKVVAMASVLFSLWLLDRQINEACGCS